MQCPHCGEDTERAPNRWKAAREKAGLGVREAAGLSGVSGSFISRVERGHDVHLRTAVKLARVYGVPLDSLVADDVPG